MAVNDAQWEVRGLWKADAEPAQMKVSAPTQQAAEHLAAKRGMLVESCWPATRPAAPSPAVPSDPPLRRCPICGSTNPARKQAKGSAGMMILLLLFWVIPGIIYAFVYSGHEFVCPDCGTKLANA